MCKVGDIVVVTKRYGYNKAAVGVIGKLRIIDNSSDAEPGKYQIEAICGEDWSISWCCDVRLADKGEIRSTNFKKDTWYKIIGTTGNYYVKDHTKHVSVDQFLQYIDSEGNIYTGIVGFGPHGQYKFEPIAYEDIPNISKKSTTSLTKDHKEIGWYVNKKDKNYIAYIHANGICGIDDEFKWRSVYIKSLCGHTFKKADLKDIREVLLKYARKNYPIGTVVLNKFNTKFTIDSDEFYIDNACLSIRRNNDKGVYIFNDYKWTIPVNTKSELEFQPESKFNSELQSMQIPNTGMVFIEHKTEILNKLRKLKNNPRLKRVKVKKINNK